MWCAQQSSGDRADDNTYTDDGCGVCFHDGHRKGKEQKNREKRIRQHTGNEHPGMAKQLPPAVYNAPHTQTAVRRNHTVGQLPMSRDKEARCIDLVFFDSHFSETNDAASKRKLQSQSMQKGEPRQLGIIENTPGNVQPTQNNDKIHKNKKKQRQQEIGSPQKRGAGRSVLARCLSRLCELLALINKIPPLPTSERAAETVCRECMNAGPQPEEADTAVWTNPAHSLVHSLVLLGNSA